MLAVRRSVPEDLGTILGIYSSARKFMRENGNPDQWGDKNPPAELVAADVTEEGHGHVCCDTETGEILGVFWFGYPYDDPTYRKIYDGEWLNGKEYGVVHRIATAENARGKGVAKFCLSYALGISGNLRIDTHRNNIPMQNLLASLGFSRCGTIYLLGGDERIAFQKSVTE